MVRGDYRAININSSGLIADLHSLRITTKEHFPFETKKRLPSRSLCYLGRSYCGFTISFESTRFQDHMTNILKKTHQMS